MPVWWWSGLMSKANRLHLRSLQLSISLMSWRRVCLRGAYRSRRGVCTFVRGTSIKCTWAYNIFSMCVCVRRSSHICSCARVVSSRFATAIRRLLPGWMALHFYSTHWLQRTSVTANTYVMRPSQTSQHVFDKDEPCIIAIAHTFYKHIKCALMVCVGAMSGRSSNDRFIFVVSVPPYSALCLLNGIVRQKWISLITFIIARALSLSPNIIHLLSDDQTNIVHIQSCIIIN